MNKATLIVVMLLVGTSMQSALANEVLIETVDHEAEAIMSSSNPHVCPITPRCIPPIQELEPEENQADNG